jgi:hypothetical protein
MLTNFKKIRIHHNFSFDEDNSKIRKIIHTVRQSEENVLKIENERFKIQIGFSEKLLNSYECFLDQFLA